MQLNIIKNQDCVHYNCCHKEITIYESLVDCES